MLRIIINVALVILLILVTLFGLGPAIYADGTNTERFYTVLVVIFLYLMIFAIMFFVNKRIRK